MPLKVVLRITSNENTKGERIGRVECIKKPENELAYVFHWNINREVISLDYSVHQLLRKSLKSLIKVGRYKLCIEEYLLGRISERKIKIESKSHGKTWKFFKNEVIIKEEGRISL